MLMRKLLDALGNAVTNTRKSTKMEDAHVMSLALLLIAPIAIAGIKKESLKILTVIGAT